MFFNNPDDEQSWNIKLVHPGLGTLAKLQVSWRRAILDYQALFDIGLGTLARLKHVSLGAMATSTLVNMCLARGTC